MSFCNPKSVAKFEPANGIRHGFAFWFGSLLIALGSGLNSRANEEPGIEVLRERVAQVLQVRCAGCHAGQRIEGGYDLTTFETMMQAGESGKIPVAIGRTSDQGELMRRIKSADRSERMPEGGPPLTASEIEVIDHWLVREGKESQPDRRPLATIAISLAMVEPAMQSYARPLPVAALAISRDGNSVYTGGYGEVLQWSDRGELLKRYGRLGRHVRALASSDDGRWLAVASGLPGRMGLVQVIDTSEDPSRPQLLDVAQDIPNTLAFAPDTHRLAFGGMDGSLKWIDVESRKMLLDSTPHGDAVLQLDWSSDGSKILTSSRDRTARVFSVKESRWLAVFEKHDRAVGGGAFAGDHPVTMDETGQIRFWQKGDGVALEGEFGGQERRLQGIEANETTIYVPSATAIRKWKVAWRETKDGSDEKAKAKRKPKFEQAESLPGDSDDLFLSMAIAPNGRIAAGTQKGFLWIWDPEKSEGKMPTTSHHWLAFPIGSKVDVP